MISRRRIMIEIPEKDLVEEFGWFRETMGENAIRSYLLRHPHIIETDLDLRNFLGTSLWFASTQEADMLFKKNGVYYIVETKQKGKYFIGWQYVKATVECFEAEMKRHKEEFQQVVAVLATSSKNLQSLVRQSLEWFPTS